MSFAALIPGIIGGLLGFVTAMVVSVAARWREDEKSRQHALNLLSLLIIEVQKRKEVLNNVYADMTASLGYDCGDAIKDTNRGKSGATFDYLEELKAYRESFDLFKTQIISLPPETLSFLWDHYTSMNERLIAHERYLDPPHNNSLKASEIRGSLRQEAQDLELRLIAERCKKLPRSFLRWLPLWIVGRT